MRKLPAIVMASFVALSLSACGSDGDVNTVDETTTTGDETTTTTEAQSADIDVDDLEDLLPDPDFFGSGWQEVEPEADDDTSLDDPYDQQCPEVAALDDDFGDDEEDSALANFEGPDGETVDVSLSLADESEYETFEDSLDAVIDAFNACTIESSFSGGVMNMSFSAEETDEYGSMGVILTYEGVLTYTEDPDNPDTITSFNLVYVTDGVGVEISATDNLAANGEIVVVDRDLLDELASGFEDDIDTLVNG